MLDTDVISIRYPSKKHNLLPLNNSLNVQSRLTNGYDVKLWRLQQDQRRREAEVCQLVENCQFEIRHKLEVFFANCAGRVAPFVDALLAGKKSFNLGALHDSVLPQSDLGLLIKGLRMYIQRETKRYFGVSRLADLDRGGWQQQADVQYIACLVKEYRRTILATELAAKLGNKACRESLCALKIPSFAVEVLDKIEPGTAFLDLFDCHPHRSLARRQQLLVAEVSGLLGNVHRHLSIDACHVVARNFYELYDLIWEPHYEREMKKNADTRKDGPINQKASQHKAV